MKVVIVGAGRVGMSVAEQLVTERNDTTVIDTDPRALAYLEERLELRGVLGNGSWPSVQASAGMADADLLMACTDSDEVNLAVCKVARMRFNPATTVARLRAGELVESADLMARTEGFGVDHVICPEASVTRFIHELIDHPGALQVLAFAEGRVHLLVVRADPGGLLLGRSVADIAVVMPTAPMRIVAIYRGDAEVPLMPNTRFQAGDEVFVLADSRFRRDVLAAFRPPAERVRRLMIAGGGRVGHRLASELGGEAQVKLIEFDRSRCDVLAAQLPQTLILNGDAADEDLLSDENVGELDLFLALTNDDEDNIMSAMLAKRMGAQRVVALINRRAYADMMQGSAIDIAVSPAQAVIGELLTHVRRGAVVAVHSLRRGAAEALEGVAQGTAQQSRLVGRTVQRIDLPDGARIGVIVRGQGDATQVLMPHHDTLVQDGDHLVVFMPHRRMVRQVERLFQVSATFFG